MPDIIRNDFLQAAQEALSGLTKVSVKMEELKVALITDGSPATPNEFRERFEQFIKNLLKWKDVGKARIILE